MLQITPNELNEIGQLAEHCDLDKLNIASREAKLFDMQRLFGDFWREIEANSDDAEWAELMNGGVFQCGNRSRQHLGVKLVFGYYVYARYLLLNGFNDTPNGHVTKTNSFSIPKPLNEVERFAAKYRDMGFQLFSDVEAYICVNRNAYPSFYGDCQGCGCFEEREGRSAHSGLGFRSKNISKWDV